MDDEIQKLNNNELESIHNFKQIIVDSRLKPEPEPESVAEPDAEEPDADAVSDSTEGQIIEVWQQLDLFAEYIDEDSEYASE